MNAKQPCLLCLFKVLVVSAVFLSLCSFALALPPYEASFPSPDNGALNTQRFISLEWLGGDPDGDNVTYDVYFGFDQNPPILVEAWTTNSVDLTYELSSPLAENVTYYWRVDATDENGATTTGDTWSFTTRTASDFIEYTLHYPIEYYPSPSGVSLGDINNDGNLDIIALADSLSMISWFAGNEDLEFTQNIITDTLTSPTAVHAADVDLDGDLDIVSIARENSGTISWWQNDGTGLFERFDIITGFFGSTEDIYTADFDNDGDIDIINGVWGNFTWFENDGNQVFTQNSVEGDYVSTWENHLVDINRDGYIDILACSQESGLLWLENDGNFNFEYHQLAEGYNSSTSVQAADFDLDGDLDIIDACMVNGQMRLFVNDGNQNFVPQVITTNQYGADQLRVADVDADEDLDIVCLGRFSAELVVWLNDGNLSFTQEILCSGLENPYALSTVDIQNDGDIDFVFSSLNTNKVYILKNVCNRSPLSFGLDAPADGSSIEDEEDLRILFNWFPAVDIDPEDEVRYTLEICEDANFTNPLTYDDLVADLWMVYDLEVNDYWWRVKAEDMHGYEVYSDETWTLNVVVDVEEDKFSGLPSAFGIEEIYPNPFNPETKVVIALPDRGELKLAVYNTLGRQVATLANGKYNAGYHNFTFDASSHSSCVYFVRATVPGKLNQLQKVVLMK